MEDLEVMSLVEMQENEEEGNKESNGDSNISGLTEESRMALRRKSSKKSGSSLRSHVEQQQLKTTTAYHFKEVLGLPPRDKWSTIIGHICKTVHLSCGHNSII